MITLINRQSDIHDPHSVKKGADLPHLENLLLFCLNLQFLQYLPI